MPFQPALSISPGTVTTAQAVASSPLTINAAGGSGTITVSLSDGGGGGSFSPGSSAQMNGAGGSTQFTYTNATPDTYTITVSSPGFAPGTATIIVTSGSPPSPTGFTLTPASRSAQVNVPTAAYVIALTNGGSAAVAGVGGQAFALSSSDLSGVFAPGTTVTVPQGQSSASFTYRSPNVGLATLTATASGAPYLVNTATAQAVITASGGFGAGGSGMGPIIAAAGMEFGEAYLYGTLTNPDDTAFAKLQSFDYKIATALKEAMGPEQYTPVGVGIADKKYTVDLTVESYSLQRYQLLLGGSAPTAQAAIVAPVSGPTLTPGAGSTTFTAGHIAVGYSYRNKFGATVMSPLTDATVTSTQQIAVTSLGALPSGVTSVDWFVSSQSYTTAPLAAAAPVYFVANNNGTAFNITVYGLTTAAIPLTISQIGKAGNVYTSNAYDEAPPFTVHCINPADGSGRNLKVYGVVCTDLSNSLKLRDWTQEKITGNVYGDTTVVPAKMHEWFAPAGFLS